MDCRNCFCIYWKNDYCILSSISVDETGGCTECIRINLPEELMERQRKKLRNFFDSELTAKSLEEVLRSDEDEEDS